MVVCQPVRSPFVTVFVGAELFTRIDDVVSVGRVAVLLNLVVIGALELVRDGSGDAVLRLVKVVVIGGVARVVRPEEPTLAVVEFSGVLEPSVTEAVTFTAGVEVTPVLRGGEMVEELASGGADEPVLSRIVGDMVGELGEVAGAGTVELRDGVGVNDGVVAFNDVVKVAVDAIDTVVVVVVFSEYEYENEKGTVPVLEGTTGGDVVELKDVLSTGVVELRDKVGVVEGTVPFGESVVVTEKRFDTVVVVVVFGEAEYENE